MSNLIFSNLKRIGKTRAFQISAIIVAALALFQVLMNYRDYIVCEGSLYIDDALFSITAVVLFPMAAFISLYIGTEYSDGTLRNKLVVGHGRIEIYLANLIIMTITGWIFITIWSVAYLVPGLILMKNANPLVVYVMEYVGMFCMTAVCSAIFTLLSMTIGKKAGSSVACIMVSIFIILSGTVIQSILDQEEYYAPEYIITESGEIEYTGELQPNPNYLPEGSTKRAVYEFLLDFTPGGQVMQISAIQPDHIKVMVLYDAAWIVVMAGIGMIVFIRKNIK